MQKLLELENRFPRTGEPTVQLAAFSHRGRLNIEKRAFAESHSPMYDFLSTVQPESGATFLLVNALGAWEYYDDNRNGDGFNVRPYRVGELPLCGHPECSKPEGWVGEDETLLKHYKSFEKHGGIFRHHSNKDATKSLGHIIKAAWNPSMHRVELLLKVTNEKAPDLIEKIGDGDFPAVSMGCHVRWDVCTICGHRAPTRAQYCDHARDMLRRVLPDGRKVSVLNPSPKFFDISFVFRPADPTGWMLKKVASEEGSLSSAELGERLASHQDWAHDIRASREKVAEVFETPYGRSVQEQVQLWPNLSETVKTALASVPLREALTSLAAADTFLSSAEVVEVMAKRAHIPLSLTDRAKLQAIQPVLEELITQYPDVPQKLGSLIQGTVDAVNPALIERIRPWLEKRASHSEYIRQQLYAPSPMDIPVGPGALYRATEPARSDVLTMTDPSTGDRWQTTRAAAMAAHNKDAHNKLLGAALLGALYSIGLRSTLQHHGHGASNLWTIPLGMAAGWGTKSLLDKTFPHYRHPVYLTDQNIPVSGGTEFSKVSSVVHREAFDTQEGGEIPRRLIGDRLFNWLTCTPLETKVAELTSGAELEASTPGDAPNLDLAILFQNLRTTLWS